MVTRENGYTYQINQSRLAEIKDELTRIGSGDAQASFEITGPKVKEPEVVEEVKKPESDIFGAPSFFKQESEMNLLGVDGGGLLGPQPTREVQEVFYGDMITPDLETRLLKDPE